MSEENESINSPDFKEIYCNSTQTRLSQWDIGLLFGQMKQGKNNTAIHESHVAVTMSPQHFKAVVNSLNAMLNAWETQFGTINFKPDFVQSSTEEQINKAIIDAQTKAAPH